MRRADRLFALVQALRRHPDGSTAARLAEELEVSPRTVYRDVQDLMAGGVPIRGEAGVGYVLEPGFDLPPLMFDEEELEALVFGARMVRAFADPDLARAATDVLRKVESVLPRRLEARMGQVALHAIVLSTCLDPEQALRDDDDEPHRGLSVLRRAVRERTRLRVAYADAAGRRTERELWPLALYFWGRTWTLLAWCELRGDFRNFRLDRMLEVEALDGPYPDVPGRTHEDFLRRMRAEGEAAGSRGVREGSATPRSGSRADPRPAGEFFPDR